MRRIRKRRKRSYLSKIFLNEVDVMILDVLDKNKDKFSVLSLKKKLKMSNLSRRIYINRLVESKFISKVRVEGQYKYVLNIALLGKGVLKIFSGLVGGDYFISRLAFQYSLLLTAFLNSLNNFVPLKIIGV